jgi:hypothetical protein
VLTNQEFKNSSLILQACIIVFFITTAAAFVGCYAFLSKTNPEFTEVSISAVFILLGIQNLLSLISGFQDGTFLLLGRRQPLLRHEIRGSKNFRKLVLVNAFFVTIAVIHIYFSYLRPL